MLGVGAGGSNRIAYGNKRRSIRRVRHDTNNNGVCSHVPEVHLIPVQRIVLVDLGQHDNQVAAARTSMELETMGTIVSVGSVIINASSEVCRDFCYNTPAHGQGVILKAIGVGQGHAFALGMESHWAAPCTLLGRTTGSTYIYIICSRVCQSSQAVRIIGNTCHCGRCSLTRNILIIIGDINIPSRLFATSNPADGGTGCGNASSSHTSRLEARGCLL